MGCRPPPRNLQIVFNPYPPIGSAGERDVVSPMKTANLVFGVILIIAGLLAGVYSLFTTCSNYALTQAMFGVPSCASLIGLGVVALVMFVVGIVVLALGRGTASPPLQGYPPPGVYYPPPQPVYQAPAAPQAPVQQTGQRFCPVCGNHYPQEYNVCPRDSSPLKPVQ